MNIHLNSVLADQIIDQWFKHKCKVIKTNCYEVKFRNITYVLSVSPTQILSIIPKDPKFNS